MLRLRLLALLLFVVAVVVRSALLGSIAIMLGSSTVVVGLWTGRVVRGLQVTRQAPATLAWNDLVECTLTVTNTSLFPVPWLQLEESVPHVLRLNEFVPQVLRLPPGGERTITYRVQGSRRGWYRLGPLRLRSGDVLGFSTYRLTIPATNVTVLPRVYPVADLALPAAQPWGPLRATVRQSEDPARPAGVRNYQSSDGVRRIDWKASARQNSLMVRRADPAIAPETTFAIAFRYSDYPAAVVHDSLERAVVAVASLAIALLGRKLPVGLVASGYDPMYDRDGIVLPLGKGDEQRQLLLRELGRMAPGRGEALWPLLARQPLPRGGTLVLAVPDLPGEDLQHVLPLMRRGQQIALLLLEPTPGGLTLARQQHLPVWTVDARGVPVVQR